MKRVLVTGGSGFIGRKLVAELLARGDLVTVLSRDVDRARKRLPAGARVTSWDPMNEGAWLEELGVVDAVVHLAGENLIRRWSPEVKDAIEKSRVRSTELVVTGIERAKKKPAVLVSASAIGIYGPRPYSEELDEDAEPGSDFLANVCKKWEAATRRAEDFGVRSVELRIGIVLGEGGGALAKMLLPFKFGIGGPVGDGKQAMSWVHRDDVVGMVLFSIDDERVRGPMNCVSPYAVTNAELAKAIGIVTNKPAWLKTPAALLRTLYGEGAHVLTTGQRVYPKKAVELGYEFRRARLVPALESILGE